MTTRIRPRQVAGTNLETLKQELQRLYDTVGYLKGMVTYTSELATLSPNVGDVVFIRSSRKWTYWTGSEWIDIVGSSGGSSGTGSGTAEAIVQVTKLGLDGLSETSPKIVDVEIPYVEGFKRAAVEVLKFKPDEDNVVSTAIDFVNTDKNDFEDDDYVSFNGAMQLITNYKRSLDEIPNFSVSGKAFEIEVDINEFKNIENVRIEVE